jgi:hypothetical protein
LADGAYTLEIESDHYKPVTKEIIIDSEENGSTNNALKIVPIRLAPKLSYPFSNVVTLYVRILKSNNQPLADLQISGSILNPACFFKSHYDRFLNQHSGIKAILENYTETIDSKVCIYPERISPQHRQQLGNAYNEIVQLSRQKIRGLAHFSYVNYAAFLKKNLMDEDFLTDIEADNGHTVCFTPDEIDDADKQKMPEQALSKLEEMAAESDKGTACFTHKKYIVFLSEYFLEENVITQYAEDKDGKIRFDLEEISTDDLTQIDEETVKELKQASDARGITDENGESVLSFRGLKHRSEKISVHALDEEPEKGTIVNLVEGPTISLKILHPLN